ncbi:MAG: hypothetical protein ACJ77N_01145 [Chloroflexota bacterium]
MKTGRTVHHVLAEWRAVERRLEREDLNGERNALEARSRALRTEYQARASGEMPSDSAVASPDPRTA